jgi:hypothetical protein
MPLVTEGHPKERKRKLWPLGLVAGIVLLLLGLLPLALALYPSDIRIGAYRWAASAGITEAPPLCPPGYHHEVSTYPGWRYSSWSIRLGDWYYILGCEWGEPPDPLEIIH